MIGRSSPYAEDYRSRIRDAGFTDLQMRAIVLLGPQLQAVYDRWDKAGYGDAGRIPGLDAALDKQRKGQLDAWGKDDRSHNQDRRDGGLRAGQPEVAGDEAGTPRYDRSLGVAEGPSGPGGTRDDRGRDQGGQGNVPEDELFGGADSGPLTEDEIEEATFAYGSEEEFHKAVKQAISGATMGRPPRDGQRAILAGPGAPVFHGDPVTSYRPNKRVNLVGQVVKSQDDLASLFALSRIPGQSYYIPSTLMTKI